MPIILDGTAGITTPMYGGSIAANAVTPVTGFKNRLINGAMMIDQRNAGASVTPSSGNTYTLDRWFLTASQASKVSIQQSSTAPTGFTNSLKVTSLSAYSVGSSDYFDLVQKIEGYNVADLNLGTANSKTFTVSFWVQSSLTGTFGGALLNGAENYSFPFTYTINSANTWEQKTVTVIAPTSGTWTTTNGSGLEVLFSLGVGSTLSGTANSWASATYLSATGATSVVGTNGATFYITGVQLEVGSTATSFDYRPYGTELALCQRYFQKFKSTGGEYDYLASGAFYNSTQGRFFKPLLVTMRTSPSLTVAGTTYVDAVNYISLTSLTLESSEPESFRMGFTASSAGSNATGYGCFLTSSTSSSESLSLSSEL